MERLENWRYRCYLRVEMTYLHTGKVGRDSKGTETSWKLTGNLSDKALPFISGKVELISPVFTTLRKPDRFLHFHHEEEWEIMDEPDDHEKSGRVP